MALGDAAPVSVPALEKYVPETIPKLDATFPEGDPHLVKAHLLVNAGLSEYVPQEIAAAPGSSSWSGIAEAKIYTSYGETFRAMRVLKRALPFAIFCVDQVDSAGVLAHSFSRAVLGYDSGRVGQERA